MVIEIGKSVYNSALIFRPVGRDDGDGYKLFDMMHAAFSHYQCPAPFYMCNANGYENAVIFPETIVKE